MATKRVEIQKDGEAPVKFNNTPVMCEKINPESIQRHEVLMDQVYTLSSQIIGVKHVRMEPFKFLNGILRRF